MLYTHSKAACALAAALTFSATAAQADWHSVDIDNGAYLPTISYIAEGDNLLFYNETDNTHVINGPDDSWTSGPIAPGERYVHRITKTMALTFSGTSAEGELIEGSFSYEEAPLEDLGN